MAMKRGNSKSKVERCVFELAKRQAQLPAISPKLPHKIRMRILHTSAKLELDLTACMDNNIRSFFSFFFIMSCCFTAAFFTFLVRRSNTNGAGRLRNSFERVNATGG